MERIDKMFESHGWQKQINKYDIVTYGKSEKYFSIRKDNETPNIVVSVQMRNSDTNFLTKFATYYDTENFIKTKLEYLDN